MGFPKGASIPLCDIFIGGGVKSPPAKWLRLIDAEVVLPDHLHCIWTLPPGDEDLATRRRLVETWFTKHCD